MSAITSFQHQSYSFEGQDLVLSSLLRDERNGTYIDIGSNHPILENNTYYFYLNDWNGICVDPNTKFTQLYAELRPRDTFVGMAVADKSNVNVPFFCNSDHRLSTCSGEMKSHYESHPVHGCNSTSEQAVPAITLVDLINQSGLRTVSLLCIDVEGYEANVLATLGNLSVRPRIVCVEIKGLSLCSNLQSNEVYNILIKNKYHLISKTPLDSIFVDTTNPPAWMPTSLLF